ncbi:MAG: 50S ribosomal protein L4 [Mollicutes bacterium PWAP]|nr:50S ribosomal protein L4 [Mollicutes bacterium PWAP]
MADQNLPKELFAIEVNNQAMFDVVMSDRSSKRQGTHSVKSRGEARGGGAKPWRQKGTGRARAGSNRSPIWVGGGRAFGPQTNRNYNLKVNKKVRKLAIASALTTKKDAVKITDFKLDEISTKKASVKIKEFLGEKRRLLIVTNDEVVFKSTKNIWAVKTVKVTSLGVEDILLADVIVMSNEDVKYLERLVK